MDKPTIKDVTIRPLGQCAVCATVEQVSRSTALVWARRLTFCLFPVAVLTVVFFEFLVDKPRYFAALEFYFCAVYAYLFGFFTSEHVAQVVRQNARGNSEHKKHDAKHYV